MPVQRTAIEGLLVLRFEPATDERGFFRQAFQLGELEDALGREVRLRQGNHARSAPGVIRGFHAEPWDKLVHVTRGTVLAAVADIRPDHGTFGEVATFLLGDHPGEQAALFVAEGLANAYGVRGDEPADYVYEVSREWAATADKRAVAWDDPDLAVDWGIEVPAVSAADRANPTLRQRFPHHPRWRDGTSDQRR
ncbi:dTDP-4-dehydrorhamnose 3,5-epimerase family protein [Egicoccus sp. AB-alg6-2]|uniref:dTDP-4-dehydrorhamnose 3,5-epimerase family protein n=1 Tax=Egicoccus sp. AB-alg6-2 TaxID=3242692 RepID=UPI00359E2AE6